MASRILIAATLAAASATTPAFAGEAFVGAYIHDVDDGISYGKFETGTRIVIGAGTTALDELAFLGKPRVHLLMGVNTAGETSCAASGLGWRFNLNERFYIQTGVGITIHNGWVNLPSP